MGKREEIALRIRTMRKSRNMTHEDLANAIGQSPSSISMYENGRREPNFETLEAIADIFNVSLASLMAGHDGEVTSSKNERKDNSADPGVHIQPRNDKVRLLMNGANKLSDEQIEQLTDMMRVMFEKSVPDLFEKGPESDDHT